VSGVGTVASRSRRRGGFRRRDARAVYDLHFGPNMTPMVDVVLVILIFFMAAAAFLGPEQLLRAGLTRTTEAPSAVEALRNPGRADEVFALEPPTLVVRVRPADGGAVSDGFGASGLGLAALRERAAGVAAELRAARALAGANGVPVAIEVAEGVRYADAVAVHDAVTAAGFERVGLR